MEAKIYNQKAKAVAKTTAKVVPKPRKTAAPKAAAKNAASRTKTIPKKRSKPDSEDEDEDESLDRASVHDASLLSATPPSAKKQKKAPAPKKAAGKPLAALENEAVGLDGASETKAKKGGATEKYQKVRFYIVDLGSLLTTTSLPNWSTSSSVPIHT